VFKGGEERDLSDEELLFGVVELQGRKSLEALERVVERDGVESGEWEAFVAAAEMVRVDEE